MKDPQEIRKQILVAALERFQVFGFNKTTMAEIAEDCRMSAANIYRFFDGKNDIMAELTRRHFLEEEELLRQAAHRPGLSSLERLEAVLLQMLEVSYELCTQQPRINEVCEYICLDRRDLVDEHKKAMQDILAEILFTGTREGVFNVPDPEDTANVILKATVLFHYPVFSTMFDREELEELARGIVRLLFKGLRRG